MKKIALATLGLLMSVPAMAETVDGFECSITIYNQNHEVVAFSSHSSFAARLNVMEQRTAGEISSNVFNQPGPEHLSAGLMLRYAHRTAMGVDKAWQNAAIQAVICEAKGCLTVNEYPLPGEYAPWIEVPKTDGIPNFVDVPSVKLTSVSGKYVGYFQCRHKSTYR
jgi:hypothetical protein